MGIGINLFGYEEQNDLDYLSLTELENMVLKIAQKQNYIKNCGLSAEVTSLAVKELQEQKKELLKTMHRKVDTL